jgi:hypothetical protein
MRGRVARHAASRRHAPQAGALLSAAQTLADRLIQEGTPEERTRLRMLMGESGISELSNTLNLLCSEPARGKHLLQDSR